VRRLGELKTTIGDQHPTVLKAWSELGDLRGAIRQEAARIVGNLENELQMARAHEVDLSSQVAKMERETVIADRAEAKLHELDREAEADRTLLKALIARSKEVGAQDGIQQADARVMSPALPPGSPGSPKLSFLFPLIVMGSALGGAALAFLRELTNRGFKGSGEIETECELPSLGSVPIVRTGWNTTARPYDVVLDRPRSSFAEAIRYVRNAIQEAPQSLAGNSPDTPSKTILITSSLPNEGKTVCAISLARSFVLAGMRVLLIDCDLRKPSLCEILDDASETAGDAPDLTDVLNDRALYTEAIRRDRAGLDFIPSQPSPFAPQDLLSRRRMRELLEQCRRRYDIVVLDAPPVTAVSDALILSRYADQTIFVVRWDKTPREIARLSTRRLLANGANLCGVVLTNVDLQHGVFSPMEIEYYHKHNKKYYLD
jgi:succinoglycan biosynthesis transport protein ExoP